MALDPEAGKHFSISFSPYYPVLSPSGRATQLMEAADVDIKEVIFPKEHRRMDVGRMKKDHLIHTPGDEKWPHRSKDTALFRQYKISVDILGRPLTSFNSSREFVGAIADAMKAHQHAYFDAHILHRDISARNIQITEEGKGLLIDWDLSVQLHDDNKQSSARRPNPTGTLQFMSAALRRDKEKCHELEDDRESCLRVLIWMAFCPTSGSHLQFLREREDQAFRYLLSSTIPFMAKLDHRPQLVALLKELTETIAVRYEDPPTALQLEVVKRMESSDVDRPFIPGTIPFIYDQRMASLKSPDWLVDTFRRYLDADPWPRSDKAQAQPDRGE